MATKKQEQELDNGGMIYTTKEGWNEKNTEGQPCLFAGWAPESAPHFSISKGMGVAFHKKNVEGVYLGDYMGIPVYDPVAIMELIRNSAIDKYDLDVPKLRIAGNRTGAKKELDAITSIASNMSQEQLEQLKALDVTLFEKLTGIKA